jgi:hypothetical protein
VHCFARWARDSDYPWGVPHEGIDEFVEAVTNPITEEGQSTMSP